MAKKNKQFASCVVIRFKEEASFNSFMQKMGISKNEWSTSPLADFAKSYDYIRDRLQIKLISNADNDITGQFVQQIIDAIEYDSIVLAETTCCGQKDELWGCYYLGKEVHTFYRTGKDVFKYFMISPEDIGRWLDEHKENLSGDELTLLEFIDKPVEKQEFVIKNDNVLIEYTGNGGVISIPDNVTEISKGAFSKTKDLITEITIPTSVKVIKDGTFGWAENLESVTLNEGLLEIEDMAFAGCSKLRTIIIPKSVTHISDGAFAFGNTEIIYQKDVASDNTKNMVVEEENEQGYIKVICSSSIRESVAQFVVDSLIKMHLIGASITDDVESPDIIDKAKQAWIDNELTKISFLNDGVYVKTTTTDDASLVLASAVGGKNNYYDNFNGSEIESIAREIIKKYPDVEVTAKFEYQGNAYFFISAIKTVEGEIVAFQEEF